MSAAALDNRPQSPHAEDGSTLSPIIYSDNKPLPQTVQLEPPPVVVKAPPMLVQSPAIQVEPPSTAAATVEVQAPVIQVQPAPVVVKALVVPKTIAGFDKESKDLKEKNDVDKYLAGLKERLASTAKLVLQQQDPRDRLSYDDQILDNPTDDVDYRKFIFGKPLISKNMYKNLLWEMQKLQD
ncbi:hypothetical protein PR202_ga21197 [Eleusine coracana subsp. coracana]|uniref:Uncharacterized protein n=1 Tax=Eleusine coracana subsp. coracana TaxID=191504 RepID=A0AAV5D017_ELECO|nr:hypothetical protein PR202_ga21197 [Eleusine coracana subsp. coracana]